MTVEAPSSIELADARTAYNADSQGFGRTLDAKTRDFQALFALRLQKRLILGPKAARRAKLNRLAAYTTFLTFPPAFTGAPGIFVSGSG